MAPPPGSIATAVTDYEQLLYDVSDGVATVTLNRPEKRNALSGELLAELVDAILRVRDDDEVRAVVLTGAGDKVFCAGADLGGFAAEVPLVQKHDGSDLVLDFFKLMPRLGKPSLCAAKCRRGYSSTRYWPNGATGRRTRHGSSLPRSTPSLWVAARLLTWMPASSIASSARSGRIGR